MNQEIVYKPYRICKLVAYIMLVLSLPFAMFICNLKTDGLGNRIFCVVIIYLLLGIAYKLFSYSRVMFVFNSDGIRIINEGKEKYCFVTWKEITYYCYERNLKGFEFLVLSSEKLSNKQTKKVVNGNYSMVLYVEKLFMIPMNQLRDTSDIKQIVEQNVLIEGEK